MRAIDRIGRAIRWRLLAARWLPARLVLGNGVGVRRTVQGHLTLLAAQRASRVEAPRNDAARALATQGWARFEHHIPAEVVDHVASEFARLIEDDDLCTELGQVEPEAHRYLKDPHWHVPAFADLLTPPVREAIEAYYGSHFRVRTIRAYRNMAFEHADESTNVFGNVWHVDPELGCDLRYFVYLNDTISAANGALISLDRRTSRRLVRTGHLAPGRLVGPAASFPELEGATSHSGRRGLGLLLDPQHCVHRAGTCAPGQHRDTVQFWITPADHPLAPDWGDRLGRDPVFEHGAPPGAG